MSTLLACVAILVAVGSMVFAGIQARASHRQTEVIAGASQLTLNLEIVSRLQEIQFKIAADPASREYVWGAAAGENGTPQIASQAMLDGMSAALAATKIMHGFAVNEAGWVAFVDYLLKTSPGILKEAIAHPQWWPEVLPHVQRIAPPLKRL